MNENPRKTLLAVEVLVNVLQTFAGAPALWPQLFFIEYAHFVVQQNDYEACMLYIDVGDYESHFALGYHQMSRSFCQKAMCT